MKKLLSIAALALLTACAFAETYSLSIGINDYPEAKDESGNVVDNDLSGCVNDANAMRNIFIKNYGVKESNTKILLDKNANGDKFLDGIKWLITTAKAGDQVIFTYSGHGAQIDDPESDEADKKTELLVLADGMLVQDDFFNEVANLLRINGVNCTFIFDSCFSGGMSRNVDGRYQVRNRVMQYLPKNPKLMNRKKEEQGLLALAKNAKSRQVSTPKQGEVVFMYASKESEPSKDISGIPDTPAHGLFTLLLLDILEAEKAMPVKDIYEVVDEILAGINKSLMEDGKKNNMEEDAIPQFVQGPNFEASATRSALPIILPN